MSGKLEGKVAVITGASSGLGRAIAERLADETVRLVLVDTEPRALARVARSGPWTPSTG